MRYTSTINNLKCVEWGLTLSQAFLLDILIVSDLWAKRETVDEVDYRWVSRNKILDEIPHAYKTADMVYRSLKDLAKKGIIDYRKLGKKDLIKFTEKGKEWVFNPTSFDSKFGKNSESDSNSEKIPSKFGKNSENSSEKIPTDNGTNLYKGTSDNEAHTQKIDSDVLAVREQNVESIMNWQQPSKKTMQDKLMMAGKQLDMTDNQYLSHVSDFKSYWEEQAAKGNPISRENLRQTKLKLWLINIADRQPKQAADTVARPHSNRSDAFSQTNEPRLTRQQQLEKNKQAMIEAGLQA